MVGAAEFARLLHDSLTRRWDGGRRLLPLALMDTHALRVGRAVALFDRAVDAFVAAWERGDNGDADRPSSEWVRSKFSSEITYEPIPSGAAMPLGAGELRGGVDARAAALMAASQLALYGRALAVVKDLSAKLFNRTQRVYTGRRSLWRETTMDALRELVEFLPHLNLEGDPLIDTLVGKLSTGVLKHPDYEIKEDGAVRAEVIGVLNDVSLYLTARIVTRESLPSS